MIPTDLLSALRAKDPELWERLVIGMPLKPYGQYIAYTSGEQTVQKFNFSYIPFGELLSEVAFAWLQHCLQEAIRARGWDFKIEKYHNSIWGMIRIPHECWTDEVFKCKADTEAAALLRAYLAALEAKE